MLHNALVLIRVYPNGTSVFSSNYDPFTMWAAGNYAYEYETEYK